VITAKTILAAVSLAFLCRSRGDGAKGFKQPMSFCGRAGNDDDGIELVGLTANSFHNEIGDEINSECNREEQ